MCKKSASNHAESGQGVGVGVAARSTTTTTNSSDGDGATMLREAAGGKTVTAQVVYHAPPSTLCEKNENDITNPISKVNVKRTFTRQEVAEQSSKGKPNDGSSPNSRPRPIWIIIHNQVYDLTTYQSQHPGGDLVLQHMAGRDATDAFENYHRAHVAKYLLPQYWIGSIVTQDVEPPAPHVCDFRALRQELLQRHMFTVPAAYYYKLYAWLASLFVASLACTIYGQHFAVHMVGAVLLGLFWQQFAGLGHDLGHSAVSKNFHNDHTVGSIIGSILTGLSTAWWKRNHNTHHIVCNAVEDDPNIQHLPLLAVSEQVIEQPYWSSYHDRPYWLSKIGATIVSYQHLFFLPLMAVARFNLYALGIKHLLNPNYKSNYRQTELWTILGIFPIWYGALASTLPDRTTMWCWIFLSHAVTMLLHLQIVISHWSMETYHAKKNPNKTETATNDDKLVQKTANKNDKPAAYQSDDWYMLQFRTTMDITCPAWLDWLHIGLQFQIVHHLYPTLPRPHLREATRLVKQVCRKHDIEFCEMGFLAMVGDSLRVLRETAQLARSGQYTQQQQHNYLAEALRAEG